MSPTATARNAGVRQALRRCPRSSWPGVPPRPARVPDRLGAWFTSGPERRPAARRRRCSRDPRGVARPHPRARLETLLRPTPSRGRSLRNLTVNVFHPFELLPAAWTNHRFDWQPEADHIRETAITNIGVLYSFAAHTAANWQRFLNNVGDKLGRCEPVISSPRGDLAFSALLSSQRWHAAYHYHNSSSSSTRTVSTSHASKTSHSPPRSSKRTSPSMRGSLRARVRR